MEETQNETLQTPEEKRDRMLVDAYLRIAALERLLVSRGVFTEDELGEEQMKMVSNLKSAMSSLLNIEDTELSGVSSD